jgi:hypothetical protein
MGKHPAKLAAMPRFSAIAAACALAVGIAACGEKDEPEPTTAERTFGSQTQPATTEEPGEGHGGGHGGGRLTPKQQIEDAVATVVGGADPKAACGELVTPRYVRQAYGDEQGCRAAVGGQKRFDVAVSEVEIEGRFATARAVPKGGPNKGETLKVELVLEGKSYRVDAVSSNAPAGP